MPDRPLILFPSPERADREHKPPVFTKTSIPSYGRQFRQTHFKHSVIDTGVGGVLWILQFRKA